MGFSNAISLTLNTLELVNLVGRLAVSMGGDIVGKVGTEASEPTPLDGVYDKFHNGVYGRFWSLWGW